MGDAELPPLLPVLEVGFSLDADGGVWPTVAIDVTEHPAVADLARVHATEGVGDVVTTGSRVATADRDLFLLGVMLTTPVRAALAVCFVLPEHHEFLEAVAMAGHLAFATTDPLDVARASPLWLAVDIDGPLLLEALDGDSTDPGGP